MATRVLGSRKLSWLLRCCLGLLGAGVPAYWAYACQVDNSYWENCTNPGWQGVACSCGSCSSGDSGYGTCITYTQLTCRVPAGFDIDIPDCYTDGSCSCAGSSGSGSGGWDGSGSGSDGSGSGGWY